MANVARIPVLEDKIKELEADNEKLAKRLLSLAKVNRRLEAERDCANRMVQNLCDDIKGAHGVNEIISEAPERPVYVAPKRTNGTAEP